MLPQSSTGIRPAAVACLSLSFWATTTLASPPYLTGVVEDIGSQVIEMPAQFGFWARTVDWMAPEGQLVRQGDIVVRIDPGTLLETEETSRVALEEERARIESREEQNNLAVLDAETQYATAKTQRQIAWLDAQIPESAVTELEFEQAQLALENADNALKLAQVALEHAKTKREEQRPVSEKTFKQRQLTWQNSKRALDQLTIRADREGYVIYGENPMSFSRIFPGASVPAGTIIATIADRSQLQFVFWVHDADIRHIEYDQLLTVIPDALPKMEIEAEVSLVSNHAVERDAWSQGGYFKVTAKPTSGIPEQVLPGMAIFAQLKE